MSITACVSCFQLSNLKIQKFDIDHTYKIELLLEPLFNFCTSLRSLCLEIVYSPEFDGPDPPEPDPDGFHVPQKATLPFYPASFLGPPSLQQYQIHLKIRSNYRVSMDLNMLELARGSLRKWLRASENASWKRTKKSRKPEGEENTVNLEVDVLESNPPPDDPTIPTELDQPNCDWALTKIVG